MNPFRKKEDIGFPLSDTNTGMNPADSHNFSMGQHDPSMGNPGGDYANPGFQNFQHQPAPLDDHRMSMPLGENIRQGRVNAMHGGDEYQEEKFPNPIIKDLELISSKLDYLKASLEAINQRLVNLEHYARQEMESKDVRVPIARPPERRW